MATRESPFTPSALWPALASLHSHPPNSAHHGGPMAVAPPHPWRPRPGLYLITGFPPWKGPEPSQGFPLRVEAQVLTVGSAQRGSNPLGTQSSGRQSGTRTPLRVASWREAPTTLRRQGDSTSWAPPATSVSSPLRCLVSTDSASVTSLSLLCTCWSQPIPHTSLPGKISGPQAGSDPTTPLLFSHHHRCYRGS